MAKRLDIFACQYLPSVHEFSFLSKIFITRNPKKGNFSLKRKFFPYKEILKIKNSIFQFSIFTVPFGPKVPKLENRNFENRNFENRKIEN